MEAPTIGELEALRYSDLQRLAKGAGLKANLKADKLLQALRVHFYPECKEEKLDSEGSSTLTDPDELNSSQEKEELVSVSFVTHRRGRGRKTFQSKDFPKDEFSFKSSGSSNESLSSDMEKDENGKEKKEELANSPVPETKPRKRGRSREEPKPKSTERSTKKQKKVSDVTNVSSAGKIPRYVGRLSKPGSKPSTPNFKKLHEAHFKKMESIDKYMERKQKRLDAVSSSIQEVKLLTKKPNSLKLEKTPVSAIKPVMSRLSLLSPTPRPARSSTSRTPGSHRRSKCCSTAKKSILVDKSASKQFVISSSKLNVRFSEATRDNEHKRSLIKTPSRKSSCIVSVTPSSEPRRSLPLIGKSDLDPTPKKADKPAITPFKFTAETVDTPTTNKKSRFDLQASLSRPLGYKPHKGKLKPWGENKENNSAVKSNTSLLKQHFKQPPLQTRDDRRKKHEQNRKGKRDQTLGARRGVC
ncbi:hypothetical protein GDO86_016367 [Hymenochirus boettgeri]|uniref:Nucleolar and spindle-associated protein 1 n=1 Tax=Hymenochirus boettgeri TaxID=247094 RepID=A0A8T2K102_9PIPI|nr:hypothetical protein GDO86_016367 [Hymenochirus boettgeri]